MARRAGGSGDGRGRCRSGDRAPVPKTTLPLIGGSRPQTRFILTCVAAVFVGLKFLFHIHFSLFGFGFWAAVVLTAGFVYVAKQARQTAMATTS